MKTTNGTDDVQVQEDTGDVFKPSPLIEAPQAPADEWAQEGEDFITPPALEPGEPIWSPYFAGLGLGASLLLAYWFLGVGPGVSGGLARFAAWIWHAVLPEHVEKSVSFGAWFQEGTHPVLQDYLVFMVLGVFFGGLLSAVGSGRIRPMVERGPRISSKGRLWFALGGGLLVGFACSLARHCTDGQDLTGAALLLTGSVVFLVALVIGGYATAYFVRKEWTE